MKRHGRQIWLLAVALVAVAAAAGCTGSDVLDNGVFEVVFETFSVNQSGTDYECVLLDFNGGGADPTLTVRPVDGTCVGGSAAGNPCGLNTDCPGSTCEGNDSKEVIQSEGILVMVTPLNDVNFAKGAENEPCDQENSLGGTIPPVLLSKGLYVIGSLAVGDPRLITESSFENCGSGTVDVTPGYTREQLTFEVGPNQSNVVQFAMNIQNLEAVLDNPCGNTSSGPGFFFGDIANILEIRK